MDGNYNETIRQGFLCPICLQDLGNISNLINHAEISHKENAKNDVVDNLRDFFGKAKQKIKVFDINEGTDKNDDVSQQRNVSMSLYPEKQDIGYYISYKGLFIRERDKIVSKNTEDTNQLIIRLDKLLTSCPDDLIKKKEFEKQIVPWTPDKDTNTCTYCNAYFNITRRRHHCRLCGKLICSNCSKFLSFITAKKLINPAYAAQILKSFKNIDESNKGSELESAKSLSTIRRMISSASSESISKMKLRSEKLFSQILSRDDNQGSVSSLLIQEENEQFRICYKCNDLLEKRDILMDQIASKPIITQLYETLITNLNEIKQLVPKYCRMADSLNEGEIYYTLSDAIKLRKDLALRQKDVDMISSKIENLGINNEHSPVKPTVMELKLQKSIRRYAIMVVQETITDMPNLPSEKTYNMLQEKNKQQTLQKIKIESEQQIQLEKQL